MRRPSDSLDPRRARSTSAVFGIVRTRSDADRVLSELGRVGFAPTEAIAVLARTGRALLDLGVPKHQARVYETKLRRGDVLVSAYTRDLDRVGVAACILGAHHAEDVAFTTEVAHDLTLFAATG